MAGAHRSTHATLPWKQLLSDLMAERNEPGTPLSGPISDRIRPAAERGEVDVNPERGTDAAPDVPASDYEGHRLSGRARRARFSVWRWRRASPA